ncbi:MAG: glycosyltransferase family 39 protein, partial [Pseudomonadota bacterium]
MAKKFVVPDWAGILLFFLIILLLYIPNFSKLGVMTPWEMNRVIVAMDLAENPATPWMAAQHIEGEGDIAPMAIWMPAIGFRLFGISEAAARIPSLVLLMLSLLITFWSISRLISIRAAYFSVLVLAVFPLTGFMSFNIGGYGTAMCFLTMSLASIALARWWRVGPEGEGGRADGELPVERLLALLIAIAALVCCYLAIGGIIGLLLPVAATAVTQLITGDWQLVIPGRAKKFIREQGMVSSVVSILFLAAFVILLVLVIPVAVSKEPEFNLLSGGTPRLGAIPTVDYFIENIAYGTYPW